VTERRSKTPSASRRPRQKTLTGKQLKTTAVVGLLVLSFLFAQVGLYAKVSKNGYERAELVARLRNLNSENQSLQAKLDYLRSPERLSAVARQEGMVVADSYERIVLAPSVRMAKANH